MTKTKKITILIILLLMTVGAFLFFRHQIYYSQGKNKQVVNFEITKGEGNAEIASKLEEQGLISDKLYFYYYVRANKLINKIMPGEYELSGNMTIPEIAQNITSQQEKYVKITFPEGWNSKQMAERLKENGLNGDGFLAIVKDPQNFKKRYSYLQDPKIKTLEGYLFPDTYFFKPDITAENIVGRMLDNFDGKLDSAMRADIAKQNKSIGDIVIMASVVEAEVTSTSDRSVVSGIFWKRIGIDMPIQSDATLTYAMDDGKSRHSYLETRVESPFNTYINKGLPPTPINSPSLEAIEAAIYPKVSDYLYFLSDPKTGTTYFAKTLDEQNINKVKVGL